MGKIDEIRKAVEQLDGDDLKAFQEWYQEFVEQRYDAEIEQDVGEGRLDKLLANAREDAKAGRVRDL